MAVGIFGVVMPVLPGLPLCFAAVLIWAIFSDAGWGKWVAVGLAAIWMACGETIKYIWPGRRMARSGVPSSTLFLGAVGGIVGFFVIPLVGLPIGFVVGIWGAEATRYRGLKAAWPSTKEALKAVGMSVLIEGCAAMLIVFTWVAALIFA
ncbi:MAG: DUF456 domain-containing protein [Corynebacteriales bacterium]|nr:DUF456 domain-containing protein [Mycobacteriales bacterium]